MLKSFTVRWNLPEGDLELGLDPILGRADTGILHEDLTYLFIELGECARQQKVGALFTVDEAQYLPKEHLQALIQGLHRISQEGLPLVVVCAGPPSLPTLAGEARSYAERLFSFQVINSLQLDEAHAALTAPAEEQGVKWSSDGLGRIMLETAGYPYFLQEFGKQAWNVASGPDRITLADVENSLPMAVRELDKGFFGVRWGRATFAERDYLAAMASLGPDPHRSGDVVESMGMTHRQVGVRRSSLIREGLCHTPRHGEIAFTVPMFDQFVRRRRSL